MTLRSGVTPWEFLLSLTALLVCGWFGWQWGVQSAPRPQIGVLRFENVIDSASATPLIDILDRAAVDPAVAAVVVEVNSPGGLATSSESIYHALLNLREQKPVILVVDGLAASGGYYMAVAGNRIFTTASSYLGNVGTRGRRPEDPKLSPEELSSGPYKLGGGSRFDRIRQLDQVKDAFLQSVVVQRQAALNPLQLTPAEVGEARLYLGSEALAAGLADLEGGRADAVREAAGLAGVTGFDTVELPVLYQIELAPPVDDLLPLAQAMLAGSGDNVLLLDSRIPFPAVQVDRLLEMQRMRATLPAGELPVLLPAPAGEAQP